MTFSSICDTILIREGRRLNRRNHKNRTTPLQNKKILPQQTAVREFLHCSVFSREVNLYTAQIAIRFLFLKSAVCTIPMQFFAGELRRNRTQYNHLCELGSI